MISFLFYFWNLNYSKLILKRAITFFALLIGLSALAGEPDSLEVKDYFFLDIGGSINSCKDELVSPLRYTGVHSSMRAGYNNRKVNRQWTAEVLYTQGDLSSNAPTVQREQIPSLQRYQFNFIYDFSLPKFQLNKWDFTAGLDAQGWLVYRENREFGNASFTFDQALTLGPTFTANRVWQKQKRKRHMWFICWNQKPHKMRWSNRVSTGLLGQASRPSYQTIINYTGENMTIFNLITNDDNLFLGLTGQVFSLQTTSALSWEFFNGNELHLTYHWNYYSLQNRSQAGNNQSEGSMNTVGLAFYYSLYQR